VLGGDSLVKLSFFHFHRRSGRTAPRPRNDWPWNDGRLFLI
jgi:hypothetical protein